MAAILLATIAGGIAFGMVIIWETRHERAGALAMLKGHDQ